MNAGIFVLLFVLLVVYVGYPLVQSVPDKRSLKKGRSPLASSEVGSSGLLEEIEFDYELGNLPEEHRHDMIGAARGGFAGSAAGTRTEGARGKEDLSGAENADDAIEREVARLRGLDIESQVSHQRTRPAEGPVKCPNCGTAGTGADKFCGQCGMQLPRKSR